MTKMRIKVLVVDDEPPIRRLLRSSLSARDYRVIEAESGAKALELVEAESPDLVVLDLGLPDVNGLDVLRQLRAKSRVPVIVLSSHAQVSMKIEALERGANDYVTKPFNMDEFVARMRVALRHGFHQKGEEPLYRSGDLTVDLVRRQVKLGGVSVKLSPTEFALLRLLVTHAGMVLTHDQILREIWHTGKDVAYLRVYIGELRKKLESDPHDPLYILTAPGVGYQLVAAD